MLRNWRSKNIIFYVSQSIDEIKNIVEYETYCVLISFHTIGPFIRDKIRDDSHKTCACRINRTKCVYRLR